MKSYGCVRNLWEGSFQGEDILSKIKPLISDLRCNWHLNAGWKHHIVLKNNMRMTVEKLYLKVKYFGMVFFCWKVHIDSAPFNTDEMKDAMPGNPVNFCKHGL
eukprot:15346132-Ditylum_brightwellii.AAC.1